MKLICLGDSLTEGYRQEPEINWPLLLKERIKSDVTNEGVSGDTTGGMLSRLIHRVIDQKPDYLIVMGGTNDVICKVPYEVIMANMISMIRIMNKYSITPIIGIPPKCYATTTESVLFRDGDVLNEGIDDLRSMLKELALEDHQLSIDFNDGLNKNHFEADGVHPTVEGRKLMSSTAYDKMMDITDGTI